MPRHTENTSGKPVRHRDRFLTFGAPLIGESEIEEVCACLRSGWLGTGPRVADFEKAFREYKHAPFAVALNSCTAALHLSMLAAGLQPGDEVITSPLTFCATVNAIVHAGLTPVLADVDPGTMNIDPCTIEAVITPKTRAILPVHFAGRPCRMDDICRLAEQHDLKIIEDCAHAIESEYKGQNCGTFGDFGCFSFYVTKNVVTGEGGMVLTRREEDAARIKRLALHGMSRDAWHRFGDQGYKHYFVVECGYKYNMMDMQAAIGIHQLRRVDESWQRRRKLWDLYNAALRDLPLTTPPSTASDVRHARHLYTVLIDPDNAPVSRDTFLKCMTAQNIGVGVHYLAIPEHPYYQKTFGWRPEDTPHATSIGRRTVSLPLSANLSDEDAGDVVDAVRRCLTA